MVYELRRYLAEMKIKLLNLTREVPLNKATSINKSIHCFSLVFIANHASRGVYVGIGATTVATKEALTR